MKKNIFGSILVAALAFATSAFGQAGGTPSAQLAKIYTPPTTILLSNATTAKIDFTDAAVVDYSITDLSGNLSLYLTNLQPGHIARVYIDTDGSARTISVLTNGIPSQVEVLYPYTMQVATNGNSAFTATNRSSITFTVGPARRIVYSDFRHYQ